MADGSNVLMSQHFDLLIRLTVRPSGCPRANRSSGFTHSLATRVVDLSVFPG